MIAGEAEARSRSTPPTPSRTPISTSSPRNRPKSKRSSPPPAAIPTTSSRSPPMRCACRPGTRRSGTFPAARSAASRCAACCCPSPTCCCSTSRPTTSMPRASTGWSSSCRDFPAPWWRSPTTATSSTTPPSGSSNSTAATAFPGRATTVPGWNRRKRASKQEDDRVRAPEDDQAGTGMGAPEPQGAPGQEQGAPGALRGTLVLRIPEAQRDAGNLHPGRRAPGQRGHRVQGRHQGLRRPPADRQSVASRCRPAPSSASSARTAPANRRCSA